MNESIKKTREVQECRKHPLEQWCFQRFLTSAKNFNTLTVVYVKAYYDTRTKQRTHVSQTRNPKNLGYNRDRRAAIMTEYLDLFENPCKSLGRYFNIT